MTTTNRVDFSAIRAANPIDEVIGRYIELKRDGREYLGHCPFHADSTPSFSVVPAKDFFHCFGCGESGDVIDFVERIEGIEKREAIRRLSPDAGANGLGVVQRIERKPPPPGPASDWVPVVPAPIDALGAGHLSPWNPKRDNVTRLRPTKTWAYHAPDGVSVFGFVARCELPDGRKWTPQVTYCTNTKTGEQRWCLVPFAGPRPIYGLDRLAAKPESPVVVVEGEKAADAAQAGLPRMVVVTWPGGTGGVKHADWSPLAGRDVVLWPDADGPGVKAALQIAALLRALPDPPRRIRWIDTDGLPDGYDAADVDGSLVEFCRARVRDNVPEPEPEPAGPDPQKPAAVPREVDSVPHSVAPVPECGDPAPPAAERSVRSDTEQPATPPPVAISPREGQVVDLPAQGGTQYGQFVSWSQLDLVLSDKGTPVANLDNASRLLERHPDVQGRFWFDDFLGRIQHSWNAAGDVREWSDADDVRLALWVQRKLGIRNMAVGTVRDAVTAVAMAHRRNECRDWLDGLQWDGVPRLHCLLPIGFGAEATPYTEAVGRCFMVGMVARALDPGCKVDYMPVFEGKQGKGKSTALQVLVGARWFAEAAESVMSKDFFQSLQGKLLVEIAEMDTFSRAEIAAVKRVVTCRVDRYRAPYGRRAEDHPRMCVFSGTTNEDEYLRDSTGARRFWPVSCSDLDLQWIDRWRVQLFAEAVARYRARESWWDVPSEDAQREQEARRVSDEWEPVVSDWLIGRTEATVGEILDGALGVKAEHWDKATQMRVSAVLKSMGWSRVLARRGGRPVRIWVRHGGGNGGYNDLL